MNILKFAQNIEPIQDLTRIWHIMPSPSISKSSVSITTVLFHFHIKKKFAMGKIFLEMRTAEVITMQFMFWFN